MTRHVDPMLPLALRVEGPVISQDPAAPVFGLDTAILMDGGQAVLPGSQIKGLLREVFAAAIEQKAPGLCDAWLTEWFGEEASRVDHAEFSPRTGRLFISDLTATPPCTDRTITRVPIDHERGAAAEGMLQVIQAPWSYGEIACFAGEVRVMGAADVQTLDQLKSSLDWAFQLIPAVGALKTAGFGRLRETRTGNWAPLDSSRSNADERPADANAIASAGGVDFVLHPKEPFIAWPDSFGSNFFAGASTIPGQVLKAVAARWLQDRGLLADKDDEDALAGLVFRHAHPVQEDAHTSTRPAAIPLSVYLVLEDNRAEAIGDALDDPSSFDTYRDGYTAAFQPDWKQVPKCLATAYGRGILPGRITRTRTAINASGAADDERLFTQAAVDPRGFVWHAQTFIPDGIAVNVAQRMASLLASLNGTSLGLGKSKAPLTWSAQPLKEENRPVARKRGGTWRVVLQTPACLHGPAETRSSDMDPVAALREDYTAYWKSVLGGAVRLVDFMVRQRLAGGYLARRYPIASKVGFEPYLLTEPGSIFVLKPKNEADGQTIQEKLDRIAVAGLPLSNLWPDGQRDWRTHPFLPEAGWGEVRISGEEPLKPGLEQ